MKRSVSVTFIAAIVVVVVGFVAYQKFSHRQVLSSLAVHVKDTSLRVESIIDAFTGGEDDPTVDTFDERLKRDKTEIERRIVEVQKLATGDTRRVTDPILSYMRESRTYVEATQQFLQFGRFQVNAAKLYKLTSQMANAEQSKELWSEATRKTREAAVKQETAIKRLKEIRAMLAMKFPSDSLISEEKLDSAASVHARF